MTWMTYCLVGMGTTSSCGNISTFRSTSGNFDRSWEKPRTNTCPNGLVRYLSIRKQKRWNHLTLSLSRMALTYFVTRFTIKTLIAPSTSESENNTHLALASRLYLFHMLSWNCKTNLDQANPDHWAARPPVDSTPHAQKRFASDSRMQNRIHQGGPFQPGGQWWRRNRGSIEGYDTSFWHHRFGY